MNNESIVAIAKSLDSHFRFDRMGRVYHGLDSSDKRVFDPYTNPADTFMVLEALMKSDQWYMNREGITVEAGNNFRVFEFDGNHQLVICKAYLSSIEEYRS